MYSAWFGDAARNLAVENHVGGQVLVFGPEAVADPSAHARPAGKLAAGLNESDGGIVVDRLGPHGFDHAKLAHHAGGVRQKFAHPNAIAVVVVFLEFVAGRRNREAGLAAGHRGDALAAPDGVGQVLVVMVVELGLVIPEIELARTAVHEEVDDALSLGGEVRETGEPAGLVVTQDRGEAVGAQKLAQGSGTHAEGRAPEELAAGHH